MQAVAPGADLVPAAGRVDSITARKGPIKTTRVTIATMWVFWLCMLQALQINIKNFSQVEDSASRAVYMVLLLTMYDDKYLMRQKPCRRAAAAVCGPACHCITIQ